MGLIDLAPFKPVVGTGSDANLIRNAFDAIQALFNGAIDTANIALATIKNSQLATGLTNGPPGYQLDASSVTAPLNVTATTEGTAQTVVTANSITGDGARGVCVEFSSPSVAKGTNFIALWLYDNGSSIGQISAVVGGTSSGTWKRYLTPTAAGHVYSIRASVDAGTGVVSSGAGGVGAFVPSIIRITTV